MRNNRGRVLRQGRIYRFSIEGREYAAFIWQLGKQFHGRIEGHPQIPVSTARTALAVRDALQQSLASQAGA
jgi:hypothetical protein